MKNLKTNKSTILKENNKSQINFSKIHSKPQENQKNLISNQFYSQKQIALQDFENLQSYLLQWHFLNAYLEEQMLIQTQNLNV